MVILTCPGCGSEDVTHRLSVGGVVGGGDGAADIYKCDSCGDWFAVSFLCVDSSDVGALFYGPDDDSDSDLRAYVN